MASEKETDAQHFKHIPLTTEQQAQLDADLNEDALWEEIRALRSKLVIARQLMRAALTYNPMVDHFKLKELQRKFKTFLGE